MAAALDTSLRRSLAAEANDTSPACAYDEPLDVASPQPPTRLATEDVVFTQQLQARFLIDARDLELIAPVGRGAFGVVFAAELRGQPVAVKIVRRVGSRSSGSSGPASASSSIGSSETATKATTSADSNSSASTATARSQPTSAFSCSIANSALLQRLPAHVQPLQQLVQEILLLHFLTLQQESSQATSTHLLRFLGCAVTDDAIMMVSSLYAHGSAEACLLARTPPRAAMRRGVPRLMPPAASLAAPYDACLTLRLRMLLHVAQALRFCHEHRIVHRDVAARNLLLDEKWDIALADFGLATPFYQQRQSEASERDAKRAAVAAMANIQRAASEPLVDRSDGVDVAAGAVPSSSAPLPLPLRSLPRLTPLCELVSVRHAAPESIRGGGGSGVASSLESACALDAWSYGVTSWELLASSQPYPQLRNEQVGFKVCEEGVRLPVDAAAWPANVCHLMQQCWSEKPESRPTMHVAVRVLQECLAALPQPLQIPLPIRRDQAVTSATTIKAAAAPQLEYEQILPSPLRQQAVSVQQQAPYDSVTSAVSVAAAAPARPAESEPYAAVPLRKRSIKLPAPAAASPAPSAPAVSAAAPAMFLGGFARPPPPPPAAPMQRADSRSSSVAFTAQKSAVTGKVASPGRRKSSGAAAPGAASLLRPSSAALPFPASNAPAALAKESAADEADLLRQAEWRAKVAGWEKAEAEAASNKAANDGLVLDSARQSAAGGKQDLQKHDKDTEEESHVRASRGAAKSGRGRQEADVTLLSRTAHAASSASSSSLPAASASSASADDDKIAASDKFAKPAVERSHAGPAGATRRPARAAKASPQMVSAAPSIVQRLSSAFGGMLRTVAQAAAPASAYAATAALTVPPGGPAPSIPMAPPQAPAGEKALLTGGVTLFKKPSTPPSSSEPAASTDKKKKGKPTLQLAKSKQAPVMSKKNIAVEKQKKEAAAHDDEDAEEEDNDEQTNADFLGSASQPSSAAASASAELFDGEAADADARIQGGEEDEGADEFRAPSAQPAPALEMELFADEFASFDQPAPKAPMEPPEPAPMPAAEEVQEEMRAEAFDEPVSAREDRFIGDSGVVSQLGAWHPRVETYASLSQLHRINSDVLTATLSAPDGLGAVRVIGRVIPDSEYLDQLIQVLSLAPENFLMPVEAVVRQTPAEAGALLVRRDLVDASSTAAVAPAPPLTLYDALQQPALAQCFTPGASFQPVLRLLLQYASQVQWLLQHDVPFAAGGTRQVPVVREANNSLAVRLPVSSLLLLQPSQQSHLFDSAFDAEALQARSQELQSARYLAPEAIRDSVCDEATEVWAVGATLWEVLSKGALAYSDIVPAPSINQLLLGVAKGELRLSRPTNSSLPSALVELMQACTQQDPASRPSMAHVCQRIRACMAGGDEEQAL